MATAVDSAVQSMLETGSRTLSGTVRHSVFLRIAHLVSSTAASF